MDINIINSCLIQLDFIKHLFMTDTSYIQQPKYFGKYQQFITVAVVILFFQLPFFFTIGLTLYAMLTFNSQIIAIEGLIIIFTYSLKKSDLFISLVKKYIVPTAYFKKFERIFDQEIPKDAKPLFCMHPHAVFSYCIVANMNCGNDKMTDMVGLASRFIYNVPIVGAIFRLFGVQSVDPINLSKLMIQGKAIAILPGGFQQASLTTPDEMRIYIKKRFGFIKYALKYGYTIYPSIALNEHKQFATFDYFHRLKFQINKLKMPAVLFFSKWLIFLNPNFEMITVVGKGIRIQREQGITSQPTKHEIHEIQQKYIEQIQRLYKKYQHLNDNSPLVIY